MPPSMQVTVAGTWAVALLLLSATCVQSQPSLTPQNFNCDINSASEGVTFLTDPRYNNGQPFVYYGHSVCFPTNIPGPGGANTILTPYLGWDVEYSNINLEYDINLDDLYKSAVPGFVSLQRIDNTNGNSPLTQSIAYSKTTTSTFQWGLSESLQLGAKFSFEVGGCLFCPGSAKSEFSLAFTVGATQQWSTTSTDTFTSTLGVTVQPGQCSYVIGATQYVQSAPIPFSFNANAQCSYEPIFSKINDAAKPLWAPYVSFAKNYTCSDSASQQRFAEVLRSNGFSGQITAPPTGSNLTKTFNTGILQAAYGVLASVTACDCADTPCIEKAGGDSFTSLTSGNSTSGNSTASGGVLDALRTPIYLDFNALCEDCLTVSNMTSPPGPFIHDKVEGIADQIAKKVGNLTMGIKDSLPFSASAPAPGPITAPAPQPGP